MNALRDTDARLVALKQEHATAQQRGPSGRDMDAGDLAAIDALLIATGVSAEDALDFGGDRVRHMLAAVMDRPGLTANDLGELLFTAWLDALVLGLHHQRCEA